MKTLHLLAVIILLLSSGCYKIVEEETIDDTMTISFSTQINPIFNQSNNCTACHKPGGTSPDLTTDNAYQEIIYKDLVNTAKPETSVIYDYASPETSTHDWKKYSATEAQTVLLWIEQGANNN